MTLQNVENVEWSVQEWIEYISLHPELVDIAKAIPHEPSRGDINAFRVALAASRAKREFDSTSGFELPSLRTAREILAAFRPDAQVIDLATRRAPAKLRKLGVEIEAVSIDSLIPPSCRVNPKKEK